MEPTQKKVITLVPLVLDKDLELTNDASPAEEQGGLEVKLQSTLINFIEQLNGDLRVEHYNGVYMGDISRAHDFHYNFWPAALNGGFWPGYLLKALSDKLDELNAPIDRDYDAWYEEHEKQMAACTHPDGIDPEDGCLDCGFYAK